MNRISRGSLCVHAGEEERKFAGAVVPPIFSSTTYEFRTLDDLRRYVDGDRSLYLYSRYTNPTVEVVEAKLAALEGGERCLITSAGQGALSATIFGLLRAGEQVVATPTLYGGTHSYFTTVLRGAGLEVVLAESLEVEAVERAITPRTRIIYTETPTNPNLQLVDLAGVAQLARRAGAIMIVDSTFGTPINQNPLALGADIVLHSGTKYLGGHSDVICGAVVGADKHLKPIYEYRKFLGANLDPHAAFLLLRGMKTLALRVERQNANGLSVARFLERHPRVRKVRYPGLESSPYHELARRQMRGFGGVLCFEVAGGLKAVGRVLEALRLFVHATSLGGVESLASIPVLTSHIGYSPEELKRADVNDGMIRLSCGIEEADDLIEDLDQALNAL